MTRTFRRIPGADGPLGDELMQVAAAPKQNPALFPARTLLPRLTERPLALESVSIDIGLPASTTLIDFGLATIETRGKTTATAVLDDDAFRLLFAEPLYVVVDPSRIKNPAARRALNLFFHMQPILNADGLVAATYTISEVRYNFQAGTVRMRFALFQSDDPRRALVQLGVVLPERIKQLEQDIQTTAIGDPKYSLLDDPDPAASVTKTLDALMERYSHNKAWWTLSTVEKIEETVKQSLQPVVSVTLDDFTLDHASVRFEATDELNIKNKAGTKNLRLVTGNRLTASVTLHANLGTLLRAYRQIEEEKTTLLASAPLLNVTRFGLEGQIALIYEGEHLASLARASITLDGRVDISGAEITPPLKKKLSDAVGFDPFAADRSITSLVASAIQLLTLVDKAGGPEILQLAAQNPEVLASILEAGVDHHESHLVEPLVTRMTESQIEAALTEEVQDLIKEYVEKPLKMNLEEILHEPE